MKKTLFFFITFIIFSAFLAGCQHKNIPSGNLNNQALDGTWNGIGSAIGKDTSYDIDGYIIQIEKNGNFHMTDSDEDTHHLEGSITVSSKNEFVIHSDSNPKKVVNPKGWKALSNGNTVSFMMPSEHTLVLTFNDISYYFEKDSSNFSQEPSALYDLAENDVWYSDDGSDISKQSYELALYDSYMELYSISPTGSASMITSFYYVSNSNEAFTFLTYRDSNQEMPVFLNSLPRDLSQIDIRLSHKDDSLTLTYNENSITFYNNVIYGLKTGGDAYELSTASFYWTYNKEKYFCDFSMCPEKDALQLHISDEKAGSPASNSICGKAVFNEKGKTITWYFDDQLSKATATEDSKVFQDFKALNGTVMNYTLKKKTLILQLDNRKYILPLK